MMRANLLISCLALFTSLAACSAGGSDEAKRRGDKGNNNNSGSGGSTGINLGESPNLGIPDPNNNTGDDSNPQTCAEAETARSYVGCEFWPTITANPVWKDFEPAVVVANGGTVEAKVTVTGPNNFSAEVNVKPGELQTIMLKWVDALKGPEYSRTNTQGGRLEQSARADKGAYKMVSTAPVTAWQFNPLKYLGNCEGIGECRSASNDASLLLPASAMTGNYRVFAYSSKDEGRNWGTVPGGFAITATRDNTEVKVQLGPKCGAATWNPPQVGFCVSAGTGVEAKNAGDVYTFSMNAGDVVQLVGQWAAGFELANADVSGSVVNANQPVQVISFNAISQLPDDSVANADHMEETVLPAEVIGNSYIVVPPTTPNGNSVGHVVRIYGNVDGTKLTYPAGKPNGAPDTINAGDMVQIPPLPSGAKCKANPSACMVTEPFIVEGDQPFAVNSYMVGGTLQMPGTDPTNSKGDPSMSQAVTPKQFRKEYTFLAPSDYTENFAEVILPKGADLTLDGNEITSGLEPIGNGDWQFGRIKLEGGSNGGVHKISTTHESGLGLQVAGFGFATSYYYPGGLNLKLISIPPVIDVR